MKRPRAFFLATAIVTAIAALPGSSNAQVSKSEAACRAAIAKATAKVVKTAGKAILACHVRRNADASLQSTDCNDLVQADSSGKIAKTSESAAAAIEKKCVDADAVLAQYLRCPTPVETVDDGGATTGIDDFPELAACLIAQAGVIASGAAREVLGSPAPPLDDDLGACHATLGRAYTKVIDTTMKVQASCQKAADKAGGSLEFTCFGADPKGKVAAAVTKGKEAIVASCTLPSGLSRGVRATGLALLDSCADDPEALADCSVDEEADVAADGASAMAFELPGNCPAAGAYSVATSQSTTDLDAGWRGLAHDMDPIVGFRAVNFDVTCDADCNNCVSGSAEPVPEACRCSNDASVQCTTNADCSGQCECHFGPPTPYVAGGVSVCIDAVFGAPITGSLNASTGEVNLNTTVLQRMHMGIEITQPCPVCTDGTCDGGARNGLACTVDGRDATLGDVSYDCPPSPAGNISGTGLVTPVNYTTGTLSLPFGDSCDAPNGSLSCACGVCNGNQNVVCNSDASCGAAGPCVAGGGTARRPNDCSNGVCSPDPDTPGDGTCLAGPFETWCDGLVNENGRGFLACSDNADCAQYSGFGYDMCPGDDCGTCTLSKPRNCFLNPIVASGSPGSSVAGVACVGPLSNGSFNTAIGLPGPYRIRQNIRFESGFCSDGVTPFVPPGGSNCP